MDQNKRFEYLDGIAIRLAGNDPDDTYAVLSTGERLYVALAASRPDLIESEGKTLVQAIARLGNDWTQQLIERWQYRPSAKAIAEAQRQRADE